MKLLFYICLNLLLFTGIAIGQSGPNEEIVFTPIEHASFVIETDQLSIYVDPVGELIAYDQFRKPDIILITHSHYDHFNADVINKVKDKNTIIIGPRDVIDQLGYGEIMNNGEHKIFRNVLFEGVPMYNMSPGRLQYHERGKGNGYVLTIDNKRIYVSGDTEDIPEMRALQNIDYAFVCMDLPYTMTVEQAASAVLEFKPKVVFPYHYRGKDGMSDIDRFKEMVSVNSDIEVRFLDWY